MRHGTINSKSTSYCMKNGKERRVNLGKTCHSVFGIWMSVGSWVSGFLLLPLSVFFLYWQHLAASAEALIIDLQWMKWKGGRQKGGSEKKRECKSMREKEKSIQCWLHTHTFTWTSEHRPQRYNQQPMWCNVAHYSFFFCLSFFVSFLFRWLYLQAWYANMYFKYKYLNE